MSAQSSGVERAPQLPRGSSQISLRLEGVQDFDDNGDVVDFKDEADVVEDVDDHAKDDNVEEAKNQFASGHGE